MKKIGLILFGGFLALLLAAAMYTMAWMQRPLGPPLELEVPPSLQNLQPAAGEAQAQPTNPALTCGNSGEMSLILLGVSAPLETGHSGADAIRLMVVDFDQVEASLLALPEDLWVETPEDVADALGPMAPLNMIYQQAREEARGNPDKVVTRKATQVLAQVIVDTFEFVPDKYANTSGEAFVELVDELGGITITLEEEVDGTPEFYGIFPQGENHLDGQRTLDFARLLYPMGGPSPDYFGRFQRQNQVLLAIFEALTRPENWSKIPDLIQDARKMVATDLSADQLRDLTCMLEEVGDQADLLVVSEDMVTFDEQGRMLPDIEAIKELIRQMYGG